MEKETAQLLWLIIATISYSAILIWGFKHIGKSLSVDGKSMLEEHPVPKPDATDSQSASPQGPKKSFSRVAGSIGAMGLASAVVALGYWILYALFFDGDLSKLQGLSTYFLSGSALFAPYAFNQLSKVFK